jgi:hypothetical protein
MWKYIYKFNMEMMLKQWLLEQQWMFITMICSTNMRMM